MLKTSILPAILVVFTIHSISIFSQTSPNSPYTRFGIGETEQYGFSQNSAMGGLSIGLRSKNEINYMNPATYNSQDSMSFILDGGAFQSFVNAKNNSSSASFNNFNVDHVAISFPVTKFWGASAGLVPYSKIAYNISQYDIDTVFGSYSRNYKGEGGINQFYFGNAFGFFKNRLNLGVNMSYLFGSINNNLAVASAGELYGSGYGTNATINILRSQSIAFKGMAYTLGLQFIQPLKSDQNITFGAVFESSQKINAEVNEQLVKWMTDNINSDTISKNSNNKNFTTPTKIGAGVSYNTEKLTIGIDYSTRIWSKSTFWDNTSDNLIKNSQSINMGFQYCPDRTSFRSYLKRVSYRGGFYYNNTYWNINNQPINDYGITIGVGLPMKESKSMFNVAFMLGKRGVANDVLLSETYSKIIVSFKFNEIWFYKRRYN